MSRNKPLLETSKPTNSQREIKNDKHLARNSNPTEVERDLMESVNLFFQS